MASSFQFGYGAPDNYSDWATYAGLDRKTGQFAASAAQPPGVAPPESFGEMFEQKAKQAVVPVNKIIDQVSAFGKKVSQPSIPGQVTTKSAQEQQDWGFQVHIE
jgi:hypothetical protein